MKTLYDLGVDINHDWNFKNGDLQLFYYDENIKQAIYNKPSYRLESLDLFYINYDTKLVIFRSFEDKLKKAIILIKHYHKA